MAPGDELGAVSGVRVAGIELERIAHPDSVHVERAAAIPTEHGPEDD
jgi:hypothetical protein